MYTRSEYYRDISGATSSLRLWDNRVWKLTVFDEYGRPLVYGRSYRTRNAARSIMGRLGEEWRLQGGPVYMVYVDGQYKGQTRFIEQADAAADGYARSGSACAEVHCVRDDGRETTLYAIRRVQQIKEDSTK